MLNKAKIILKNPQHFCPFSFIDTGEAQEVAEKRPKHNF